MSTRISCITDRFYTIWANTPSKVLPFPLIHSFFTEALWTLYLLVMSIRGEKSMQCSSLGKRSGQRGWQEKRSKKRWTVVSATKQKSKIWQRSSNSGSQERLHVEADIWAWPWKVNGDIQRGKAETDQAWRETLEESFLVWPSLGWKTGAMLVARLKPDCRLGPDYSRLYLLKQSNLIL